MPALPYIGAAMSIYGGIQQNKQARATQEAANRSQEWQRYLDEYGLTTGYESARNWERELPRELSWDQAVAQAESKFNPLYQEQMDKTLEAQANANKRRGFYGQAPGDLLMQERAAEVERARLGAIGDYANQLQQASQARADQHKQFGVSQFGTYGNVTAPIATGSGGSSGGGSTKGDKAYGLVKTLFDPGEILLGSK